MLNFFTKRRDTELDLKILVANAAINAAKDKARAELVTAKEKLALRIAERDAAPREFKRAYEAAVKAQSWVCDRLKELAE